MAALAGLFVLAAGCGGGEESEALNVGPYIRISVPGNGFSTTDTTVAVSGSASRPDGTFPHGSVTWSNAGSSGTEPVECGFLCCLFVCVGSWQADIPLQVGSNTITVSYGASSASVTVTRIPVFAVSGRLFLQASGQGLSYPSLRVALESTAGSLLALTASDASGSYSFGGLTGGDFTLEPRVTPPASPQCLAFDPASRSIAVAGADVPGQDFSATQPLPCFAIRGQVTASTNPGFGLQNVQLGITDAGQGSFIVRTDVGGFFEFQLLRPGTYTVEPSSCVLPLLCATFVPASRTVTITEATLPVRTSSSSSDWRAAAYRRRLFAFGSGAGFGTSSAPQKTPPWYSSATGLPGFSRASTSAAYVSASSCGR